MNRLLLTRQALRVRLIVSLVLAASPTILCAQSSIVEVTDCVVRFADEVEVPSLESGRIAEIAVKLNQRVNENETLARLDDRTLKIRRRASSLRLEHARQAAGDDVEQKYAETALAEAKAELDSNRSIYNDVNGAVPMSHLRRLRLAVERGELEVAQAEKRRRELFVEVQLREADLAMLDDQIENLGISSPLAGTVVEIARSSGEWIEKGQPIATVAKMDRLHVHALVREDQLSPKHCAGLPVSVHFTDSSNGNEKVLRGNVLSSDPQRLPGGRYRLHAEVINQIDGNADSPMTQWMLVPGTSVRMRIDASDAAIKSAKIRMTDWR
ncbi:multidrug resistance protein MdtN [Novipirellula aureliae]|uniref:Multidrug resistance protein MdtN n=1 Tax=Novipirellula aureliae TaxID=2527966 RepID=A0A5C6E4T0_9BACT|nr:HlyD family efflux transporter periplasmic adaptor subunit [Novipirellula aureliae]TWU43918.1 multidrug resistance protein MdtN [Novipirellula aureliae]